MSSRCDVLGYALMMMRSLFLHCPRYGYEPFVQALTHHMEAPRPLSIFQKCVNTLHTIVLMIVG